MKQFLTTSETAEICGVAHTTVIRWITDGRLKAFETPGGHRRIERNELAAFLKHYNIPVPACLHGGKFKVLAVDDDRDVLAMLRKMFSEHEDRVDFAATTSGMEALVMLGESRYDLVLVDVVMPGMDGIEFCRTLRKNRALSRVRIIAITGKNLTDEQESYLEANAEAVLRKPFLPSVLIGKVQALM